MFWTRKYRSDTPIKLHIGGKQRRDGWVIFSAEKGGHVDVKGNCTDLRAFADGSCSDVYCSHVLEHLSHADELLIAMSEFYRVLAPGGVLRVSVPDLTVLFGLFIDPKYAVESRANLLRYIFGGQIDEHDFHKCGFDMDILSANLYSVGFRDLVRVDSFGLFQDSSELIIEGQRLSINVIANKPMQSERM